VKHFVARPFPIQFKIHFGNLAGQISRPLAPTNANNIADVLPSKHQSQQGMPTTASPTSTENPLTTCLTGSALHYQRILAANPHQPDALIAMSLIALASRQLNAAIKMARVATTLAPCLVPAWVALGQSLKASGELSEAEHAYAQALQLDGTSALAHAGLGELKIVTGQAPEAIRHFRLALQRNPASTAAHIGLGNAFATTHRHAEALAEYGRALAIHRPLPEAEFAAGFILHAMNCPKDAEIRYRRALLQRPDFAAAWINLGSLLREQGRDLHAHAALQRAVELRPDLVSAWTNLALLAREQRRPTVAEAHLRKAFALNPGQVETLVSWCQFRAAENDQAGAWQWLRWALARDPDHAEAANMHGILLHNEARFAEAIEAFKYAETLGNKPATSNRANSLLDLGRMPEALHTHELAVQRDPFHPGALYNLALTQLRLGDFQHGWSSYEARWKFREVHRLPRLFSQPRWRGEPLNGRRILLHAEQGLGDTLQFCRFATLVAARGGFPILQVQSPVERVLHSLPVVRTGLAQTILLSAQPPPFDFECPLMSLPAIFATTVDSIPWQGAYLAAEPSLDDNNTQPEFQDSLLDKHAAHRPVRIGIAWAGNPRYKGDGNRSMRLDTLTSLLQVHGIDWISLQKGEPALQLSNLPPNIHVRDCCSRDRDLADTAAVIAALDLVITTDTCIAHLAGAMAKPVWILLAHLADWRWMQSRSTTPWYPTARLFRQPVPGDWPSVLQSVIAELRAFHSPAIRPARAA